MKRSKEQWLAEYQETHLNPTNKNIHTICVPLIAFSLLGILWQLSSSISILLNGATVFSALSLVFYARLGLKPFIQMLFLILVFLLIIGLLQNFTMPHLIFYVSIFIVAWIGQFVGHKIEGKKPSFFKDIQFLLIGPLWVFHSKPEK